MRIGKFKINRELVFAMPPEDHLGRVFQYAIPVKIEWDFNGQVTYTAISKWFDDIEDGLEPPLYEYVFHRSVRGTLEFMEFTVKRL